MKRKTKSIDLAARMSNAVIVSEKQTATTERRMVRLAGCVSLLEHFRNEEILEEARVEQIAIVMKIKLEWF